MLARIACAVAPLALLLAGCGGAGEAATPNEDRSASVATIDPAILADQLEAGSVQLIDVRSPAEFAAGHIAGAINLPLETFDPATLPETDGKQRVLYCRTDRRSGIAAEQLVAAEGEIAIHLEGGIVAWEAAGEPVITSE